MKVNEKWVSSGLECLKEEFGEKKVNKAIDAVKKFEIEIPSWVFGKFGGGRFGEYMPPAPARNIYDKLDDAAFIYKLTGVTPRIATHILWDFSDNGMDGNFKIAEKVKKEAIDRGIDFGAVNPTYFLKGSHRGSFTSIDEDTRNRYIEQTILGGEIANKLGNNLITLWFPDGTNYPGQLFLKDAYFNMRESLKKSYSKISKDVRILIEYKVFEPGTYSTTISDWGTAYLLSGNLGNNVGVLIDLGHHYHGKNIEQIVAMLTAVKIPAGFHFNNRYAADDDQSVEPNSEMARIFYELVNGNVIFNVDNSKNWAFMIDQCSARENRIHAILHSIDSLQLSLAKSILVDTETIIRYQKQDELILANRVFNDALINADVRPIVYKARSDKGLQPDILQAYIDSSYQQKIEKKRK